jgi:hypothetical protein
VVARNANAARSFGFDRGFAVFDYGGDLLSRTALPRNAATRAARPVAVHALLSRLPTRAARRVAARLGVPLADAAENLVERTLAVAARRRDRPLFLWVHLLDPHRPYRHVEGSAAPPELRERLGRLTIAELREDPFWTTPVGRDALWAAYRHEVAAVDRALLRLLEGLGPPPAPGRIVVLTSDHGEEFLEHGGLEHGHSLHQELLAVPLVIAGVERSRRGVAPPKRGLEPSEPGVERSAPGVAPPTRGVERSTRGAEASTQARVEGPSRSGEAREPRAPALAHATDLSVGFRESSLRRTRGGEAGPLQVAGLVDLAPTLLARAGLPSDGLPGRDLLAAADPGAGPSGATAASGARAASYVSCNLLYGAAPDAERAVRRGRWKLVARPAGAALYDLASDPGERFDRARAHPERVRELAEADAGGGAAGPAVPPEAQDADALRALGYAR